MGAPESLTELFDRVIARLIVVQDNVSWFLLAVLVVQAVVFASLIALSFVLLLRRPDDEA